MRETKFHNNFGKTRSEITELDTKQQYLEGHLDLSDFVNLEWLHCLGNQLTSIDLSKNVNLERLYLYCSDNKLTNIDFLNTISNPEKLEILAIYNNNIQPTDIAIFSKFGNLRYLKIGTTEFGLIQGKHNKFYGSLKSYQNLTKLIDICIEATDVDSGLEYLPESLAQAIASRETNNKYSNIECSPHNTNAKCKAIQDQLRPYNYDLEAWQLAHPEKMLIVRPELFASPDSKDKWIEALKNKIKESQEALNYLLQNEPNKETKIIRLETQIKILEEVENQLREEIEEEREIHEDAMKAMDNFYQQNPPTGKY